MKKILYLFNSVILSLDVIKITYDIRTDSITWTTWVLLGSALFLLSGWILMLINDVRDYMTARKFLRMIEFNNIKPLKREENQDG